MCYVGLIINYMNKYEKLFGSWEPKLRPFLESEEFKKIGKTLKEQSDKHPLVFPAFEDMFNAFKYCPYSELKVVILTSNPIDPCAGGDGIAFSQSNSLPEGPGVDSLAYKLQDVIFDAIMEDFPETSEMSRNPDLTRWAEQGVLLLNCNLSTNFSGKPSFELWKPFVQYVMRVLNQYNTGLIFCLVGTEAQKHRELINLKANDIIPIEHPIGAVLKNRKWNHQGMFEYINRASGFINNKTINWT